MPIYEVYVEYEYEVSGRKAIGNTISYGPEAGLTSNQDRAEELAIAFPVGTEVVVFYNPQRITESTLVPGPSANFLVRLGLLVIGWLTLAILLIVL